ncbi:hypothetical protein ACHAWF_007862 [Thalassiosira exigua]
MTMASSLSRRASAPHPTVSTLVRSISSVAWGDFPLPRRRPPRSAPPSSGARPALSSASASASSPALLAVAARSKSTLFPSFLSSSNSFLDDVRDRAARSASAFDARHGLDADPVGGGGWRARQLARTLKRPMRPRPRRPMELIPPSPELHSPFYPPYSLTGRLPPSSAPPDHVLIHNDVSITKMRAAARLARRLLDLACSPSVASPGVTTEAIDDVIRGEALRRGAYPSPLNYVGFPKSLCSSVNEVICHGIPDSRPLELGDIVSFDVSCYLGGVHGDNCGTIVVGDVAEGYTGSGAAGDTDNNNGSGEGSGSANNSDNEAKRDWPTDPIPPKSTFRSPEEEERFVTARRLVRAALESRDEGVKACKPGGCLSDVGAAIHAVADAYGYDTVREYRGHGIGSDFHCAPFVKASVHLNFSRSSSVEKSTY